MQPYTAQPLAIIGMGCHLPGACGLDQYWELLKNGISAVGELPEERFNRALYFDTRKGMRAKSYSSIGGVISLRTEPPPTTRLSARDLANCDPAHIELLHV